MREPLMEKETIITEGRHGSEENEKLERNKNGQFIKKGVSENA